jgi:hypothetical protein
MEESCGTVKEDGKMWRMTKEDGKMHKRNEAYCVRFPVKMLSCQTND